MLEETIVGFAPEKGISIVGADIVVDEEDFEGVHIAAGNLVTDFGNVTEQSSILRVIGPSSVQKSTDCILIGTLIHSTTIRSLVLEGKISVSDIEGRWETWKTLSLKEPGFGGYENALVIVGSDKRGAIFGTYSLSEQIGVSPWYWWADVPIKKHTEVFALPVTTTNGEPSVKYRGIFINDEAPAMDTWVHEKFGPKFTTEIYRHVFELLLRLKANFVWPGMWRGYPFPGRSFFVDDPKNQETADAYGIVVGTSHHEPMQRAMNEWSTTEPGGTWNWQNNKAKVRQYFEFGAERAVPYESYITMGMRGEGDSAVSGDDPIAVIEDVLQNQREIIKDKYGSEDGVMQLMALYNEVGGYYDRGLKIPDDVTLLFADDNFGSIRRVPTEAETQRRGGCGYYYHFEYTGFPRSYRWMNSNTLGKAWHQLQLGYSQGANQIWIFNVGDIKPMELPMSFAFDLAWNVKSIKADDFTGYFKDLAIREFGHQYADQIAQNWFDFDRLVALRKHEHIDPQTFSVLKYNEAEEIVKRWQKLTDDMERIYAQISEPQRAAFFQLVLHPVKASYIYNLLRMTQTKNASYAKQRRNTANRLLHECIDLLEADRKVTEEYHSLLDGKWNHMLRQPRYGYSSSGIGPSRDMIEGLCWVQTKANSNPVVGQMGVAVEGNEGTSPGIINEDADRTHPSRNALQRGVTLQSMSPYGPRTRYFEIFHRGTIGFTWQAKPQYEWMSLSLYEGTFGPDDDGVRVYITVDWSAVPADFDKQVYVEVIGSVDGYEKVWLPLQNRQAPAGFTGFVETDTYVSINVGNWPQSPYYQLLSMGRQDGGSVTLPFDMDFNDVDSIPFLRYDVHLFIDRKAIGLELDFNMTLETEPNSRMQYDIRWDGGDVQTHRLTEDPTQGSYPNHWSAAVMDCVWRKRHNLGSASAGSHTIEVRFRNRNVVLEKIVLDLGGTEMKYLGPPQSDYISSVANSVKDVDGGDSEDGQVHGDIQGDDWVEIGLQM